MPAWWRGKSKSSLGSSAHRGKDAGDALPAARIEKARSLDTASAPRRFHDSPREGGGAGGQASFFADAERTGHPLPRPAVPDFSPRQGSDHGSTGSGCGTASGSMSVSSVSSSGSSSDEVPDLGNFRRSEAAGTLTRGRNAMHDSQRPLHVAEERHFLSYAPVLESERLANLTISPRRDCQTNGAKISPNGAVHSHQRVCTDLRSPCPGPRGYNLPRSPIISRACDMGLESPLRKQLDDLKNPPHPLPLPPTSPASPSLKSKWRKGKLLGRGSFGRVYVGFNSESGQMCAIKEVEIITDDSNSRECLKQLNQEINLLNQLSHPNIVQYYGSELVDDTLAVYLEYVSGGSIYKLVQDYGPLKEPVIRSYVRQILSGLAYLHGRNCLHRDIKGANILVDPCGEIKLVDFGLAKYISSCVSVRSFKGSPYWMAPEVVLNTRGYSHSVDIWSLGCTIIEMATAKPPWSQHTGVQAIFKIGNSKDIPEIPDHLSNDGKSFLRLCLQRDPAARPTAVQLMDHPFVQNLTKLKISKAIITRDPCVSSTNGIDSPSIRDVIYNRSLSPLADRAYSMKPAMGYPPIHNNPSDVACLRMNMSLPVSPCTSPLRRFRHANTSCIPSPSCQPYAAGTVNYGQSKYSLYPLSPNSKFADHWPDLPQNGPRILKSPRR